jgi:hypothetical protein
MLVKFVVVLARILLGTLYFEELFSYILVCAVTIRERTWVGGSQLGLILI